AFLQPSELSSEFHYSLRTSMTCNARFSCAEAVAILCYCLSAASNTKARRLWRQSGSACYTAFIFDLALRYSRVRRMVSEVVLLICNQLHLDGIASEEPTAGRFPLYHHHLAALQDTFVS